MFDIIAFRLGPVVIYGWGLAAALGALLAYALLMRCTRRAGLGKSMAQRLMLWAMPLGLLFARLVYCLVRYEQVFYDPLEGCFLGLMPLIHIDQGGLSIMGMLLGVFLAAFVVSKLAGQPFSALADAMALPLALFCAIALMGQILGGEGYGGDVAEPRWQFFPIAVQNVFGEWSVAVFMLQGLATLLIGGLLILLGKGPRKPGDMALYFLIFFCAAQVFFESLRRDNYLRLEANGFIRVTQVMAMTVLLAVVVLLTVRSIRAGRALVSILADWLALVIAIAAAVGAEFYEKIDLPMMLLFAFSAAALLGLSVVLSRSVRRLAKAGQTGARG